LRYPQRRRGQFLERLTRRDRERREDKVSARVFNERQRQRRGPINIPAAPMVYATDRDASIGFLAALAGAVSFARRNRQR
jgi:hypothetical protein